jgi:hypothetical protein
MYPTTKYELKQLYNDVEQSNLSPSAKLILVKMLREVAQSYVTHHQKIKYSGYIPGGH